MTDVEALAAKLREAEETIRQLQARLKEVEAERDRYGQVRVYKPFSKDEWSSVADLCRGTDQMIEDYTTGQVVPFEEIVREVEERVREYEQEEQAKKDAVAREPAA
jgi:flagellar biosynthesis chaperone FliJ